MSGMAMKRTILAAGFILLALAWAQAQEVPGLTPEQKFFFETVAARRVLRIPERYEQVCITPIGIPSEWPRSPAKKELADLVVYDSF